MTEAQIVLENILQSLAAGILVGGIYGLMCVGLALIFGIMRVINFAQGDFMMLGMYAAFTLSAVFGLGGIFGPVIGPYVAIALAAPLMFLFGLATHRGLISQVTGARTSALEGEGHYAQLILTLGVALILQNGAMIVFGSELQSLRSPLSSRAWEIGPFWGDFVTVFLNKARSVSAVAAVLIIAGVWLVISRTRTGKSLRAAADNPEASVYMGIDVDRAHRIAFAMGISLTAVAGGLLATNYPFHPFVGLEYVIIMYAGVVLGGIGSTIGPFWGGMTIGLVQQLSTLILPTQLQNTAIFVLFLLIVTLRPQGFFGRVSDRT